MDYLLPHHPSLASLDPLDVCGDLVSNSDSIAHSAIIEALLSASERHLNELSKTLDATTLLLSHKWSARFCELLQDIAYSLHGVGDLDTGFLEQRLATHKINVLQAFLAHLLKSARSLAFFFPKATLEFLSPVQTRLSFTSAETDGLLAHLLLGTVQIPKGNEWGRPGFTALYQSSPAVPSTVTGYLDTLIDHFALGGYESTLPPSFRFEWNYSCTSCQISPEALAISTLPLAKVTPVLKSVASEPTPTADSSTFILLSAHSQPGPGPAGTHEERLTGQSPALAVTSLICPRLESTVALLTSPFPIHAAWEGHNRYARLTQLYQPGERVLRRYIIADAAELDVQEQDDLLPDLKHGVVEREIGKLEAGFGGCVRIAAAGASDVPGGSMKNQDFRIEVVPWGCQAFGGNLVIKAQCMMMAGGLAGIDNIHLMVTYDREEEAKEIEAISKQKLSVGGLYRKIRLSSS